MNSSRETHTYDAHSNMLTYLREGWSNWQWANGWLYTCAYDANRNRGTESRQVWADGQWTIDWGQTATYDANGHMLADTLEFWSNSGSELSRNVMFLCLVEMSGWKKP